MKQIKNLKIETKEGFEVKNLQRFPSQEWGESGGLSADLYLNGIYVGNLYQAGNGGAAIFHWSGSTDKYSPLDVKEKVHTFLLRNDKDYGPNSKYEFMRDKTPKTVNDDDIEILINIMEEEYDTRKQMAKSFKNGYKSVARIDEGYQFGYVQYKVENITKEEVIDFLKKSKIAFNDLKIYTSKDLALAI